MGFEIMLHHSMVSQSKHSHYIANDFQEAIKNDDLTKFISLCTFTSNRKHVLENLLLDFFEIRTLVQEICSFFEFPALKEIQIAYAKTHYYRGKYSVMKNIWNSLCFEKNWASEIFKYILQNSDLDIAIDSGLKHYFSFLNQLPGKAISLENGNILSKILKNPKVTKNEFEYGLQEIMKNKFFGPKHFKLFFNHEFIHLISSPFDEIWDSIWLTNSGQLGFKRDTCKNSFLHQIIKNNGSKEALIFCINNLKFNINYQNYVGDTAFHLFIKRRTPVETNMEIMDAFLSRKDFNVELKNKKNRTIFDLIERKQNEFEKKEERNLKHLEENIVHTEYRIKKTEKEIKNLKSNLEYTKENIKNTKENMKKYKKDKKSLKRKLKNFMKQRKKRKKND